MKDARERRRRAEPAVAPEPAGRQALGGLLALQRSAGNAAVTRALLQRVGGWHGRDIGAGSANKEEMTVTDKGTGASARRIPIDGIPQGNQAGDLDDVTGEETVDKGKDTEHVVKHKVSERASESAAGGRAIVVIPTGMKLGKDASLDVLLHLHGHTTGYRGSKRGARDISVEHIEEQVAAAAAGGRPLIAVLPQGKFHSSFGAGGKSFDPTPYLDSVWKILGEVGAWDKDAPPKRGGLILSGHSGGDAPMEAMLDKAAAAGSGEVADLKGLFLLDTMYGSKDATRVTDFVKFRLGRDIAHLAGMQAAKKPEKEQLEWVRDHGFRVHGAHSGGHYKPQMKQLAAALTAFLADAATVKVLGAPGTPLNAAVAANLVIDTDKASGSDHDGFVGEGEHLKKAIETLPR